MKSSSLLAVLCAASLLATHVVRAGEPHVLSLLEAREITLRNHPRITQAELEALASKQVVNEVRAGYLPTIMFNATAVGTGGSNTRIAAGGMSNSAIFERNAEGVNVSQLITDFGRTHYLLDSSRLSARAADAGAEATREEIMLQVDDAFYAALKAQSVLTIARHTVDTRKVLLDQVSALTSNKLRSELDLSFAKVAYQEGVLLAAKADNDLKEAFTTLSTLLGDREQNEYQLIEEPIPDSASVDPSILIDRALANRPDLARYRYLRDASLEYSKAQRALSFPTVSAFGASGYLPVRDETHLEDHYAAAGVNLSLPLFDGGLNAAKRSEAKLRAQASEARLRDAENLAIHDVRASGLQLNYAVERLDLTGKLLENSRQALELAEARYKLGSASIVELSQAQLNQTSAEIAHTAAKYDCAIQQSILDFETGVSAK